MPGDEELGFEAAVAALGENGLAVVCVSWKHVWLRIKWRNISLYIPLSGLKTTVSEAEHPLLCEGTRREKGDLALALMITYKDDQSKL